MLLRPSTNLLPENIHRDSRQHHTNSHSTEGREKYHWTAGGKVCVEDETQAKGESAFDDLQTMP
jgi:hypothetical protein